LGHGSVSFLNCLSFALWNLCVQFFDVLGVRDHLFRNNVNETKEFQRSVTVILEVERPWMHGFITNYTNCIERFLG